LVEGAGCNMWLGRVRCNACQGKQEGRLTGSSERASSSPSAYRRRLGMTMSLWRSLQEGEGHLMSSLLSSSEVGQVETLPRGCVQIRAQNRYGSNDPRPIADRQCVVLHVDSSKKSDSSPYHPPNTLSRTSAHVLPFPPFLLPPFFLRSSNLSYLRRPTYTPLPFASSPYPPPPFTIT
jgi:hypothetical protein